jgi:hypothetical protein
MVSGEGEDMSQWRAAGASVQVYLRGVSYPADKEVLLDKAAGSQAPDGVMQVLGMIGDGVYKDPEEVRKEIDRVTDMKAYEWNEGIRGIRGSRDQPFKP